MPRKDQLFVKKGVHPGQNGTKKLLAQYGDRLL
jgi:hypothetical protein